MTDEQAQNIVNAVWAELRSRSLDIEELVDNSDRELLQDIYDGLKDAVLDAAHEGRFSDPLAEEE